VDSALALQYIPHVLPLSFRNERSNSAAESDEIPQPHKLGCEAAHSYSATKQRNKKYFRAQGQINKTLVLKSKKDLKCVK
jgi:hypothetical protein